MHDTTNARTIENLDRLLADATVFSQKMRHYHWNVRGAHFYRHHALFESLYETWAEASDGIAERILQLGAVPGHTLADVLAAATLSEDREVPAADRMLRRTADDLRSLRGAVREAAATADADGDRVTAALLDDLCAGIEKDLWMIGATLNG